MLLGSVGQWFWQTPQPVQPSSLTITWRSLISIAASAEDGLTLAEGARPDLVVLDVRLPGMDGLTAMSRFSAVALSVPIVVITAFGNLDTAVRAMQIIAAIYNRKRHVHVP